MSTSAVGADDDDHVRAISPQPSGSSDNSIIIGACIGGVVVIVLIIVVIIVLCKCCRRGPNHGPEDPRQDEPQRHAQVVEMVHSKWGTEFGKLDKEMRISDPKVDGELHTHDFSGDCDTMSGSHTTRRDEPGTRDTPGTSTGNIHGIKLAPDVNISDTATLDDTYDTIPADETMYEMPTPTPPTTPPYIPPPPPLPPSLLDIPIPQAGISMDNLADAIANGKGKLKKVTGIEPNSPEANVHDQLIDDLTRAAVNRTPRPTDKTISMVVKERKEAGKPVRQPTFSVKGNINKFNKPPMRSIDESKVMNDEDTYQVINELDINSNTSIPVNHQPNNDDTYDDTFGPISSQLFRNNRESELTQYQPTPRVSVNEDVYQNDHGDNMYHNDNGDTKKSQFEFTKEKILQATKRLQILDENISDVETGNVTHNVNDSDNQGNVSTPAAIDRRNAYSPGTPSAIVMGHGGAMGLSPTHFNFPSTSSSNASLAHSTDTPRQPHSLGYTPAPLRTDEKSPRNLEYVSSLYGQENISDDTNIELLKDKMVTPGVTPNFGQVRFPIGPKKENWPFTVKGVEHNDKDAKDNKKKQNKDKKHKRKK